MNSRDALNLSNAFKTASIGHAPGDTGPLLPQLFEARAAVSPEALALDTATTRLTFREVNERANQLARHLQFRGIGSGSAVGIGMERCVESIVSQLAILKVGAAFVPLDPGHPAARLEYARRDAGVSYVITSEGMAHVFPDETLICLDRDRAVIARESVENLDTKVVADSPAYILYTSGSTGKPKGVAVRHSQLAAFLAAIRPALGIRSTDVCLHASSLMFVVSVRQVWVPLLEGATLAIAGKAEASDPIELFAFVKRHGVTVMDIGASYWRTCIQILSALTAEERHSLLASRVRQIASVGEPLWSDVAGKWSREFLPKVEILNVYGQTETGGPVAIHRVRPADLQGTRIVPIGRALPGVGLYVLDEKLRSVSEGEQGMLFVAGPTLSDGYLNQPELTHARFVADPFSITPARMYSTGDIVKAQPDGTLEFISRQDHQVKIRGLRVELGEIESVLNQHPSVACSAVVVADEGLDRKRLLAYVVGKGDAAPAAYTLRSYLATFLQDYMIPSTFVGLESMPRTPNGKIDRTALPRPATNPAPSGRDILDCLAVPAWDDSQLPPPHSAEARGSCVVLCDAHGRSHALVSVLMQRGFDVVCVRAGSAFVADDSGFALQSDSTSHFEALFERLSSSGRPCHHIVHCWSLSGPGGGDSIAPTVEQRRLCFDSLIAVARALSKRMFEHPIRLDVVSGQAHAVLDSDLVNPAAALAVAAVRVIALEFPGVIARHIDGSGCPTETLPVRDIMSELNATARDTVVAWRRGQRKVPQLQIASKLAHPVTSVALRHRGVYLITGGLGGIGLTLAGHLSHKYQAKLVLVGRTPFPARASWRSAVANAAQPEAVRKILSEILAMEEKGGEVLTMEADVSDLTQMREVVRKATATFGQINGVIHAAGSAQGGLIAVTRPTAEGVLLAKIQGSVVLAEAFGAVPLDFLFLCSSLTALQGRVGFLEYSAANAFLDGFAASPTGRQLRSIALNWDTWASVGMDARSRKQDASGMTEHGYDLIEPAEGVRVFEEALRLGQAQLVVSKRDLSAINAALLDPRRQTTVGQKRKPNARTLGEQALQESPRNSLEAALLTLWQELLEVERVGIHDDFFALGGDSLLAMRLVFEIRNRLGRNVCMVSLMSAATIAKLAAFLAQDGSNAPRPAASMGSSETFYSATRGGGPGTPLFHIPSIAGYEFLPRAVAQRIGSERPFFDGFEFRGLDGKAKPSDRVEAIAADLVRQLRAVRPRGPYCLSGFCFGGLVAYEVARQLTAAGETISALVMWDSFPAGRFRRRSVLSAIRSFVCRLKEEGWKKWVPFLTYRIRLSVQGPISDWMDNQRTIQTDGSDARETVDKVMRGASRRARAHYRPKPYRGRIMLVRTPATRIIFEAVPGDGWGNALQGPVEFADFDCNHLELVAEPIVTQMAERMANFLKAADIEMRRS